ncbi:MAG: hypothetical protein ABIP63_10980 [Thermoanaerobaculia bacterium]
MVFDPATTQADFQKFSRIVGQAIFATPVQPARSAGVLGFDIGVAVTAVKIDEASSYWKRAVPANSDLTRNGYVLVPRLVASKGFGSGTLSGSYAKLQNSDIKTWGGALDLPIIRGSIASPELAFRASYATLTGIDVFREKTYGAEVFLSKGIGPVTPYAAVGRMRTNARGTIAATALTPAISLSDVSNLNRYTLGVRVSLFIPKIVVEATQAEVRSYAAKISVGF